MKHHTKNKGDIGLTKIISDLTEKEFYVSLPISEHLPYDLIFDDGKCLRRVQVKYRNNGVITNKTTFSTSKGLVIKKYDVNDFELYGIYLPSIDKCIYIPHSGLTHDGITVRITLPKSKLEYHWWEDFVDPTSTKIPTMRKLSNLDKRILIKQRRVKNRPSIETIKSEINILGYRGTGKKYGVSDNAIRKWIK